MGEAVRKSLNGIEGRWRTQLYRNAREDDVLIRQAAARLAIYRKLKDLGISDERIVHVYRRSLIAAHDPGCEIFPGEIPIL